GGVVVGLAETADLRVHAGDVDHTTPAAVGHVVQELLGDQEDAAQVHVDDRVPHLLGHLLEGLVARDAGVVDQDVHTAKVAEDLRAHLLDFHLVGDVVSVVLGPAPQVTDGVAHVLGEDAAGVATDGDVGAYRGQGESDGLANAPRGPRDEGDLA